MRVRRGRRAMFPGERGGMLAGLGTRGVLERQKDKE